MRIDAARLEVLSLLSRLEAGEPVASQDVGDGIGYACEVATKITRDSAQALGGHGFILDHPVGGWYTDAATLATVDFDVRRTPFVAAL